MAPTRRDITFGVEFEFLVPTRDRGDIVNLYDLTAYTRAEFARDVARLADVPVAAQCPLHDEGRATCILCEGCGPADKQDGLVFFSKQRPAEPRAVHPMFRHFHVQKEMLSAYGRDGHWTGLEMSTPVYGVDELDAGLPHVRRVVAAMREARMAVLANRSCGMHIHVGVDLGPGPDEHLGSGSGPGPTSGPTPGTGGMRLALAQKVATLAVLLDRPLLMRLLPVERTRLHAAQPVSDSSRFARRFAAEQFYEQLLAAPPAAAMLDHLPPAWSAAAVGAHEWNGHDPAFFRDTLQLVWGCRTLRELREGLALPSGARAGLALLLRILGEGKARPGDGFMYNISDSVMEARHNTDYEGSASTFEWRFPQMGFDADFIAHWAALFCKIVELAMLPPRRFAALLDRLARALEDVEHGPGPGLDGVWPVLDLPHHAPFWRAQLERQARGELYPLVDAEGILLPLEP